VYRHQSDVDKEKPPMPPAEALKQLEAFQIDIGRSTNLERIV
jgi:hypothetical protein